MLFSGPASSMFRRFDKEDSVKAAPGGTAVSRAIERSPHSQGSASQTSTPTRMPCDEATSIAAMFAATERHWEETQEKMAK